MHASPAAIERGYRLDSVFQGSVSVVNADGDLIAWSGDPNAQIVLRSPVRVAQAVPLITTGAADTFGFWSPEIAMACASWTETPRQQAIVASMLRRAGLSESELRCGVPVEADDRIRSKDIPVPSASPVARDCSGTHVAALAICHQAGWDTDGLSGVDHPLQRLTADIIAAACGISSADLTPVVESCSIPAYRVPLRAAARLHAVFANPDTAAWMGKPEWKAALNRLHDAMVLHPELVAGDDRLDTTISRATNGRVIARLEPAENVLFLSTRERRLGIAIEDPSGSRGALRPTAIAVLGELGLADPECLGSLEEEPGPSVHNFPGVPLIVSRPAPPRELSRQA